MCLFHQGHGPSSALHCLKTELKIKHADDYNQLAADTYYMPSFSVVHKLYQSECRKETGKCLGKHMAIDLQVILSQYCEGSGGTAKFGRIDDACFIGMCSPLMARVHELVAECSKLVMVDVVVGRQARCRRRIYSFLTPSPAGMLPLGVIFTETENEGVFESSLRCLKSCFPEKSFFSRGSPEIFLIDSDVQERQALERVFDNSCILFDHLHTLRTMWSWLCDAKNNIHKSHRQDLYLAFRSVLCAETEADMISRHLFLVSHVCSQYNSFACYYDAMWNTRSLWALALRSRPHNTSCVEVSFWIWKECVLNRIISFSLPQLFGLVCSCYELYMERRLVDFCNGRYQKSLLRNLTCDKSDIPNSTVTVVDEQSLMYSVKSPHLSDEVHTVELEKAMCSCYKGCIGKLCGHMQAVLLTLDERLWTRSHLMSAETRHVLFRVATGTIPPLDWLSRVNNCDDSVIAGTCSDVVGDNGCSRVSDEEIEQFCNELCMQMKDSMQKSPHAFAPVFQQMHASVAAFSTDAHFPNALRHVQEYTGAHLTTQKCVHVGHSEHNTHSIQIDIQPAAAL